MAKIYISYSKKDKELVQEYIDFLKKFDHSILMDETVLHGGEEMQKALMNAQRDADGTIVFITPNSIESKHVNSEIGMARSYRDMQGKFLIPLIQANVSVPYVIKDLNYIEIDNKDVFEAIKEIQKAIENSQKKEGATNIKSTNPRSPRKYSKSEATEIQKALKELGLFTSQPDGSVGPATIKAIKDLQSAHNLPTTGDWDDPTKQKAEELLQAKKISTESPRQETKQQVKDHAAPKYWLLKIHGDHWQLENFKAGAQCYFNSYSDLDEPRPDYENFKMVAQGDKGLGYDYSSKQSLVFSFEIVKSLHADPKRGEIISFRISAFFDLPLPLRDFISAISIASSLQSDPEKKLYTLTKTEFETLSNLARDKVSGSESNADPVSKFREFFSTQDMSISAIFSDAANNELKDQLGFESDVNALASVIAYKDVNPPLAIGLFGNWGSGKSFFMNKLEKRIEYLSKKGGDAFCKKILSITFNSWHYSDSNLWASLITKIFEDLEKYGQSQTEKVSELFQNLNSTKELLEETKLEKQKVDTQIATLEKEKAVFDKDAAAQANELNNMSAEEMIETAMKSGAVKDKIASLKSQFPFLELKDDNIDSIKENISALEDTWDKFRKSLSIIYSFRKGKIFLAILCILAVIGIVYYLSANIPALQKLSESMKVIMGAAAVLVSKFMLFLKPTMKTVNTAYKKLEEINGTIDDLKAEALTKFAKKQEELQQKIDVAKEEGNELQKKIDILTVQQQQLQNEIKDITTGRKIIRFIESRVTDQRYISSLGIISWIRKDFEQLNSLFKQQVKARELQQQKELAKAEFELERIILYIDDLDRCDESIVVKVLEAIHLLLAFPLFVVVVGVDPRWMHNALNKKYADFLHDPAELEQAKNGTKADPPAGKDGTNHPLLYAATSFDYLEKIFQIPFVLKPIDPLGKSRLIRAQLEEKKAKEEEERIPPTNGKDTPPLTPDTPGKPKVLPVTSIDPMLAKTDVQTEILEESLPGKPQIVIKSGAPDHVQNPKTKEEHADEEQENIPIATETLHVSEEEIVFMQNISFLIGESPRTIKRYVNIYRIIRTHAMFEFVDDKLQDHYNAAMLILAFITGSPEEARHIITAMENCDKSWSLNDFIRDYRSANPGETAMKKLDDEVKFGKRINAAGNIKMEKFQKNLRLISRFSFRNFKLSYRSME